MDVDVNVISQLVATVGFPIAVTAYLLWDSRQSRLEHKEEMDKVTTALNNNTEAIVKLSDRIDFVEKSAKQDPSPSE